MVVGIIAYFVLRSSNPEALERVGDVYGGDTAGPEATVTAPERTSY